MEEWINSGGPDARDIDTAMSQIPGTFGRLVFVAKLIGSIELALAEQTISGGVRPAFKDWLKRKHEDLFWKWLGLALPTQAGEIAEYFGGEDINSPPLELLNQWIQHKRFEQLVPAAVNPQMRSVFCSDLQAILRLLRIRLGIRQGNWRQ